MGRPLRRSTSRRSKTLRLSHVQRQLIYRLIYWLAQSSGDLLNIRPKLRPAVFYLQLLLQFLRRHLLLVWMMLWAILVGATVAAVSTIINPNAAAPLQRVRQPAAVTQPPSIQAPTSSATVTALPNFQSPPVSPALLPVRRSGSPLSMVGAILISCAAGCFTLTRCLTPRSPTRVQKRPDLAGKAVRSSAPLQLQKPVQPLAAQASSTATRLPELELETQRAVPQFEPEPAQRQADRSTDPAALEPSELAALEAASELDKAEPDAPEAAPVPVSLPEADCPFDWIDPSLADSLNLRRSQISYWL